LCVDGYLRAQTAWSVPRPGKGCGMNAPESYRDLPTVLFSPFYHHPRATDLYQTGKRGFR